MSRQIGQKHWWTWPLKIMLWAGLLLGALVVSEIWKTGEVDKANQWGLLVWFGILAFCYAYQTIIEKLDAISWRLEDIERRFPPESPE